jgi:ribonucleotide reductase alpha subunit
VNETESIAPCTSNLYVRKTLAGEFTIVNQHLINELIALGIWNDATREKLIAEGGSVQNLDIPKELKRRFRTAREIHPSIIIMMNKAIAPFVCQSISMSLFTTEPNLPVLLRFLVEGWKAGLKTGMYYYYTSPASIKKTEAVKTESVKTEAPTECKSCVL